LFNLVPVLADSGPRGFCGIVINDGEFRYGRHGGHMTTTHDNPARAQCILDVADRFDDQVQRS